MPAETFAFKPPAGAREAVAPAPGGTADGRCRSAAALTGQAGTRGALPDLEGQPVKAVGDGAEPGVVVLDFWATWCPPCRAGMPHLQKVAQQFTDRGVRVYAINQREDVATINTFLAEQKLAGFVTLRDAEGAVAKAYAVGGIPQTVVIGGDGVVKKVIVGFDPAQADALGQAVEEALK
jgi:thiol-disulfide isomerase/thioredoxin